VIAALFAQGFLSVLHVQFAYKSKGRSLSGSIIGNLFTGFIMYSSKALLIEWFVDREDDVTLTS
jgi:hypothetical protein